MSDFERAFDAVIGHEGGFTDAYSDRGNWTSGKVGVGERNGTKYGISAMSYPHEDIRGMTLDRARTIYRADFWDKVRGDDLPYVVAFNLFDAAVNSGRGQAIRWLQRAAEVADDGIFGPITLAAALKADPDALAARLLGHRLRFMTDLSTWKTFGKGWARRIAGNLIEQ